jgi:hypothetical protein
MDHIDSLCVSYSSSVLPGRHVSLELPCELSCGHFVLLLLLKLQITFRFFLFQ